MLQLAWGSMNPRLWRRKLSCDTCRSLALLLQKAPVTVSVAGQTSLLFCYGMQVTLQISLSFFTFFFFSFQVIKAWVLYSSSRKTTLRSVFRHSCVRALLWSDGGCSSEATMCPSLGWWMMGSLSEARIVLVTPTSRTTCINFVLPLKNKAKKCSFPITFQNVRLREKVFFLYTYTSHTQWGKGGLQFEETSFFFTLKPSTNKGLKCGSCFFYSLFCMSKLFLKKKS